MEERSKALLNSTPKIKTPQEGGRKHPLTSNPLLWEREKRWALLKASAWLILFPKSLFQKKTCLLANLAVCGILVSHASLSFCFWKTDISVYLGFRSCSVAIVRSLPQQQTHTELSQTNNVSYTELVIPHTCRRMFSLSSSWSLNMSILTELKHFVNLRIFKNYFKIVFFFFQTGPNTDFSPPPTPPLDKLQTLAQEPWDLDACPGTLGFGCRSVV